MLDPGVDGPFVGDFFGGADFALRELVAEFEEDLSRFGIVFDFALRRRGARWRISGIACGKSIREMPKAETGRDIAHAFD